MHRSTRLGRSVRQGAAGAVPPEGLESAPAAEWSDAERRLLLLPCCNAVSARLLVRRAGGLAELRAAPLARLVQMMPELPVRILAALQRHLQPPEQTAATSGWVALRCRCMVGVSAFAGQVT